MTELETPATQPVADAPDLTPPAAPLSAPPESPEAEPLPIAADPPPLDINQLPREAILEGLPREALIALWEHRLRELGGLNAAGKQAFEQSVRAGDPADSTLYRLLVDVTGEAERLQDALKALPDAHALAPKLVDAGGKPLIGMRTHRPDPLGGRELSGEAAVMAMRRRAAGGVKRVPLYNSGFCVDLRQPTASEVTVAFHRSAETAAEFGRILGAHFYMHHDALLKDAFVDLIFDCVVDSTLQGWSRNKTQTLREHIALTDYHPLLWSLATLMFPDGYEGFQHLCLNPDCRHVITGTVDLRLMLRHNYRALPDGAVAFLTKDSVTPLEAAEYRQSLGFRETVVFGTREYQLRVPSLSQYLAEARRYVADLTEKMHGANYDQLQVAVYHHYARVFTPWVERVVYYAAGEPPVVDFTTSDPQAIALDLDTLHTEDPEEVVVKACLAFANRSTISFGAYPVFACPSCGHTPDIASGFFTVDPQRTFFTMALQKLRGSPTATPSLKR